MQEEIIACPYRDVFPYINETIHQKWNTEWNETNDKLKVNKPVTWSWKEMDRCRKDETVINRLRAGHALLTHGYLMEDLPMPECELCHSHAMTVKHLITECANLASLRLRLTDSLRASTQSR